MAVRPVFVVLPNNSYCVRKNIEFTFFNGFSDAQKKRCVNSLHQSYLKTNPDKKILEISSKSREELGVKLSAFYLTTRDKNGKEFSVESAFQAGKIFENGGPYLDLLEVSSRIAKRDERLKNSGRIIGFTFDGQSFETEPKTLFYHWLYIHALYAHQELAVPLLQYDAFTDIEFNPQKSINCQAEAAAIYVSLSRQGVLEDALQDKEHFQKIVYARKR